MRTTSTPSRIAKALRNFQSKSVSTMDPFDSTEIPPADFSTDVKPEIRASSPFVFGKDSAAQFLDYGVAQNDPSGAFGQKTPHSDAVPKKIPLEGVPYKLVEGGLQGIYHAHLSVALHPLDRVHTRLCTDTEAKFPTAIKSDPWKGLTYTYITNCARMTSVYSLSLMSYDFFLKTGFVPIDAKVLAGLGTGAFEAVVFRGPLAKKAVGWASHNPDFEAAWKNLSPIEQLRAKKIAGWYGLARSGCYWMIMPGTTDYVTRQLQATFDPQSYAMGGSILAVGGFIGSYTASIFSYPPDLWLRRKVASKDPLIAPMVKTFHEAGLWPMLCKHTHRGALTSTVRMGISGIGFNLAGWFARKTAEEVFDVIPEKSKRPEPPQAKK